MANENYQPPVIRVRQNLSVVLPSVQASLNACVIGPVFDLFRYTNATERALMTGVLFEENTDPDPDARQLVPYEGLLERHIVDEDYVKLYAEKLEGQLTLLQSRPDVLPDGDEETDYPFNVKLLSLSQPNKLRVTRRGATITAEYDAYSGHIVTATVDFGGSGYPASSSLETAVIGGAGTGAVLKLTTNSSGVVTAATVISPGSGYDDDVAFDVAPAADSANVGEAGVSLIDQLYGRPVKSGDVIYATQAATTYRRVVREVERETAPATFGTDSDKTDKRFAASASNPIQTESATFGNVTAPPNWSLLLAANTVLGATVSNGGTGYTAPVVAIAAPPTIGGALAWPTRQATAQAVVVGGIITGITIVDPGAGYVDGGVTSLTISDGGEDYVTPPTVVVGAPATGGRTAVIEAVLTGGEVTGYKIIDPGHGYSVAPSISFTGGGGTGATATSTRTVKPTITITDDDGADAAATSVIVSQPSDWNGLVEGAIYGGKYAERYVVVVTKGGSAATECRCRIRSASGGFSADNVVMYHYGYGYMLVSEELGGLTLELRHGSSATQALRQGDQFSFVIQGKYRPLNLTAGGQLLGVSIIDAGSGYTDGDFELVITAPPTGGTQAEAEVTIDSGAIESIRVTNPGNGYLYPPVIALPGGAGAGTEGVMQAEMSTPETSREITPIQTGVFTGVKDTRYLVKVSLGALGTAENPYEGAVLEISDTAGVDRLSTITDLQEGVIYDLGSKGLQFTLPDLDTPTQGAGTAVRTGNTVASVTITDPGAGYLTAPAVSFTGGGGTGATATAVIANGKIVNILVTAAGTGYVTDPTVVIGEPEEYQLGLRTGDVYYVDAVAESQSGSYSVIVLNGQAADVSSWDESDLDINLFDLDIRVLYTGILDAQRNSAPDLAWEAGDNAEGGIFLRDTLSLQITERDEDNQWIPVKESSNGRLFAHWRGLVPPTEDSAIALETNADDIITKYGIEDQDNPLCYGLLLALRSGFGKPVYAGQLATNDLAGYTTVLTQAERVLGIYAMVALTYDSDVKELVQAHVESASGEIAKRWRRAYLGTRNVGPYAVMNLDTDENSYEAQVLSNGSANIRVVAATPANFTTSDIRAGDLFRTSYGTDEWGAPTYAEYVVASVEADDELLLVSGPTLPITPAVKFEIWRPDNGRSQSEYIASDSASYNQDRRIINIWVDSPTLPNSAGVLETQPAYYVACEYAGIRAAVLPQQGLTNYQITRSITAAPLMFTKYTSEDLNRAAASGTLVVTQEYAGGPVLVRHQLTTCSDLGPLYAEDSAGIILDQIAYDVADIIKPYHGLRNVTPSTLEELETKLRDKFNSYKELNNGLSKIGPMVLNWSDLQVNVDQNRRDKVNISATFELPLPLNEAEATLNATVGSDATFNVSVTTNTQTNAANITV